LAGSFVDASQREIKVLLGLCVTQLYAYQTRTEGVYNTIDFNFFICLTIRLFCKHFCKSINLQVKPKIHVTIDIMIHIVLELTNLFNI
jgi:hypothetical protein